MDEAHFERFIGIYAEFVRSFVSSPLDAYISRCC